MGPQRKGITPEVMTVEEVAEALRVSKVTVYRWQDAGKLQGRKVGRRLLFKREDVVQIIENGMEG